MTEFQEYPKMLYHPKTGEQVIVRDADRENEQLEAWGVSEPPKLELRSGADNEGEGAPKPKAAPKARARKPKGA